MAPTLPPTAKVAVLAVVAVAVLSTAGGAGSFALFTDTTTSEDNTVSAGTWTDDDGDGGDTTAEDLEVAMGNTDWESDEDDTDRDDSDTDENDAN